MTEVDVNEAGSPTRTLARWGAVASATFLRRGEVGLAHAPASRHAGHTASGNFRRPTNNDLNPDARIAEHGDQRIDTESTDLAPDEIADSGLGHTE